jgi:L1 cell adhesion molecule like protein
MSKEINVLVFDLGGGTLDTSLLTISTDGVFEVRAISGDTRLGGSDFDNRLIEYVANEFNKQHGKNVFDNSRSIRKLRTACENAKCELSTTDTVCIDIENLMDGLDFTIDISRSQFEDMCNDLFTRCIELTKNTLKDANLLPHQIEDVVLVGGSTRIPKVQSMLSVLFQHQDGTPRRLCKSINPDEAVAFGAAIQAAMLNYVPQDAEGVYRGDDEQYDENLPDYVLLDVNPLSLGLETTGGLMNVIIPRNTTIPITKTKVFSTVQDNQTAVTISVYEGERTTIANNRLLGEFELTGIEPMERGMPQIEVTFEIDADGIFTVRARDISPLEKGGKQGDYQTLQIKQSKRDASEVQRLIDNAKSFEEEDLKYRQLVRAKTQFVNMLYATRTLITKDPRVSTHIEDGDRALLESLIVSELQWVNDCGGNVTDKNEFEERLDRIQTDTLQPIIDKINKTLRNEG